MLERKLGDKFKWDSLAVPGMKLGLNQFNCILGLHRLRSGCKRFFYFLDVLCMYNVVHASHW